MPELGTMVKVGFIVYSAPRLAGTIRDPSVSVPREAGAYPAVTPTVEPDDDPAGFCVSQYSPCQAPNTFFTHAVACKAIILPKATLDICRFGMPTKSGPAAVNSGAPVGRLSSV